MSQLEEEYYEPTIRRLEQTDLVEGSPVDGPGAADYAITASTITLPHQYLLTVVVKVAGGAGAALTAGVDYNVNLRTGVITTLGGGALAAASHANVAYTRDGVDNIAFRQLASRTKKHAAQILALQLALTPLGPITDSATNLVIANVDVDVIADAQYNSITWAPAATGVLRCKAGLEICANFIDTTNGPANPIRCDGNDGADGVSGLATYATGLAVPFIVPAGVTSIDYDVKGAGGGYGKANGGKGGRVQGTLTVTPGETLLISVGLGGVTGAVFNTSRRTGAGGGGSSGIYRGVNPLAIAGGGGGGGGEGSGGGAPGAGGDSATNGSAGNSAGGGTKGNAGAGGAGGTAGGAGNAGQAGGVKNGGGGANGNSATGDGPAGGVGDGNGGAAGNGATTTRGNGGGGGGGYGGGGGGGGDASSTNGGGGGAGGDNLATGTGTTVTNNGGANGGTATGQNGSDGSVSLSWTVAAPATTLAVGDLTGLPYGAIDNAGGVLRYGGAGANAANTSTTRYKRNNPTSAACGLGGTDGADSGTRYGGRRGSGAPYVRFRVGTLTLAGVYPRFRARGGKGGKGADVIGAVGRPAGGGGGGGVLDVDADVIVGNIVGAFTAPGGDGGLGGTGTSGNGNGGASGEGGSIYLRERSTGRRVVVHGNAGAASPGGTAAATGGVCTT
jgi:hypothetical protein